jgi:hypothetical protein
LLERRNDVKLITRHGLLLSSKDRMTESKENVVNKQRHPATDDAGSNRARGGRGSPSHARLENDGRVHPTRYGRAGVSRVREKRLRLQPCVSEREKKCTSYTPAPVSGRSRTIITTIQLPPTSTRFGAEPMFVLSAVRVVICYFGPGQIANGTEPI